MMMMMMMMIMMMMMMMMMIIIIMGRRNKLSTFEGTNRPAESKIITGRRCLYLVLRLVEWF